MKKFDIRLRRQQFTQSRIERHKNYQSLLDRHHEANRRKTRGIMVLVFLLILILAIFLVFFNTFENPEQKINEEEKIRTTMNIEPPDHIRTKQIITLNKTWPFR